MPRVEGAHFPGKAGLLAGILAITSACARQEFSISNVWMRETMPGQVVGGVYMDIVSAGDARLLSATSAVAGKVEIHNMTMEKGVMKMFPVEGIDLPAGKTVKLAPGGYHIMLFDLKQGFKKGDSAQITLTIEDARKAKRLVTVTAEARDHAAAAAHRDH